jgi:endonuclease YncB( thermonuclease family)
VLPGLLSVLGLLVLVVALVGVGKGSLPVLGLARRRHCATAAVTASVVMLVGGAPTPESTPGVERVAQEDGTTVPEPPAGAARVTAAPAAPEPAATAAPAAVAAAAGPSAPAAPEQAPAAAASALLVMAAGGDGDSWRDTNGVEYRMGLINTPETNECGGSAATTYRKRALAGGFRATVYATDGYGRKVSVIVAPDGVNLNVAMARDGVADDRYLERFRHQNPALAAQLDAAFRDARAAGRGIWSTCSQSDAAAGTSGAEPAPAPPPVVGSGCHPDYATCIPIVGDGSGRGAANDLDCGEINETVHLRQIGRDPYRLDGSDQDGIGCE